MYKIKISRAVKRAKPFVVAAVIILFGALLYASLSSWKIGDAVKYPAGSVNVQGESGNEDVKNAVKLFDSDTNTKYSPDTKKEVEILFTNNFELKYIKVYDSSSYKISI